MRKSNLYELNLAIPKIDLLEARNSLGGAGYNNGPINDGGEIDPVVVEVERPDDPERTDPQEEDRDEDNHSDYDRSDNNNTDQKDEKVRVPNGACAPGSLAAALQAMMNTSAADALRAAMEALQRAGVDTSKVPENDDDESKRPTVDYTLPLLSDHFVSKLSQIVGSNYL